MKLFIIFTFLLITQKSFASWLCKDASSQAQGNHFYACGVAESNTLNKARKQSLLNAKEEFHAFCRESPHCRDKEYIITPMRTDCNKKEDKFTCYRGLDYRILDVEKNIKDYDLDEIKRLIHDKEEKLKILEEKFRNIQYLQQLNSNINLIETTDKIEVELENLKLIKNKITNDKYNSAGFNLFYTQIPLSYGNESLFGIGPEYERLIYKDLIGIRANINYIMSTKQDSNIEDRGTPNTISNPDYHSHKGIDANICLPIHFKYMSIAPKLGHTSVKYKSTIKMYSNFGVAQDTQIERHSFDDNYIGLNFRYENKFFIDVEPRKYNKSKDTVIKFGVGINIDF